MSDTTQITIHFLVAVLAGGAIGLERSFHARPAGFRTHTLVCVASSLLMALPIYQSDWLPGVTNDTIRTDPTRMAQGIMTGIGFLGAGVIFKEGLNVRGLTTAASIWMTSAIGILIGVGFYAAGIIATVLTLGVLTVFRWIEDKLPSHSYAHHAVRFARNEVMTESELRALLKAHGFSVANMSYRASEDGASFEYKMIIRTTNASNTGALAESLRKLERVRAFRISPAGE